MSTNESQAIFKANEYGFLLSAELPNAALEPVQPRQQPIERRMTRGGNASQKSLLSSNSTHPRKGSVKEITELNEKVNQLRNRLKHLDYQKERNAHLLEMNIKRKNSVQDIRQSSHGHHMKLLEQREKERMDALARQSQIRQQNRASITKIEQSKAKQMLDKAKISEQVRKEKEENKKKIEEEKNRAMPERRSSLQTLQPLKRGDNPSNGSFLTKYSQMTDNSYTDSKKIMKPEPESKDDEYQKKIEQLKRELDSLAHKESAKLDDLQEIIAKAERAKNQLAETFKGSSRARRH